MKALITATFSVTPTLAMAIASTIIYCAGVGSKKALIALALTGIGGIIVAAALSIGLVHLANKYGWSASRLSFW